MSCKFPKRIEVATSPPGYRKSSPPPGRLTGLRLILAEFLLALTGFLLTGCLANDGQNIFDRCAEPIGALFFFTRPEFDASPRERKRPREALLRLIDGARREIEIWCYGLDDPQLIRSLKLARERGVRITITGSPDQDYENLKGTNLTVRIRNRSGLQHAKVTLIDRRVLFSGTGNFTVSGLEHNHNSFFQLPLTGEEASRLAGTLYNEYDESAPLKIPLVPASVLIAPLHGKLIQQQLLEAILSARHRIRYLIFSHSDPVLTGALYLQARRGVIVEGIYDDFFDSGSPAAGSQAELLNSRLALLPSALYLEQNKSIQSAAGGETHGGHLHHKTLIIDERRVLTGSYNWSLSARDTNLEIFFDLENPLIAARYIEEFERILERSRLLGRSPLSPPPPVEGHAPLYFPASGGEICWRGEIPREGFTVFSGRGPYRRARFFRPGSPGTRGCLSLTAAHRASTAPEGLTTHPLPSDMQGDEPVLYVFNLERIGSVARTSTLPCERPEVCAPLVPHRVDTDAGFLWLTSPDGVPSLQTMRIWGRTGLSSEIALRRVAGDYYEFEKQTASPGDSILFFRAVDGKRFISCLQTGTAFNGPALHFLQAFKYLGGERPRCIVEE